MPAFSAEAYMLMLRPVPVIGEAWAIPFNGQVQIEKWEWALSPKTTQSVSGNEASETASERGPRDRTDDSAEPTRPELARAEAPPPFDADALIDAVRRMQRDSRITNQAQRDRKVRELIEKAASEHNSSVERAGASTGAGAGAAGAGSKNDGELTFTFSKSVDLATSQMLYSLANNDLVPSIILTLFYRSSHSPMTLVITMMNCRLTGYNLSCSGTETISEMSESWSATYEQISYIYQNRPPVGIPTSTVAALTQGRVKTFVMIPRTLPDIPSAVVGAGLTVAGTVLAAAAPKNSNK